MWLHLDDTGLEVMSTVMTIVAIVAKVLNRDDVVLAMMGTTIQLPLRSVVSVWLEFGLVAMMVRLNVMQRLSIVRHMYHPRVEMSLELWMGEMMHQSLLFHLLGSTAVPYFLLCGPSWTSRCPLFGILMVTPDKIKTLAPGPL